MKVDAGNGLPVSNLATLAWKIRSTIGFRRPGSTFGSRGRRRTLDNSNAGRQFQCGPFNHRSSSQKTWKGMEIYWTDPPPPPTIIKPNVSEFSPISSEFPRNKQGPFPKNLNYSLHRLSLIVPSPKSSFRSGNDCATFHPFPQSGKD